MTISSRHEMTPAGCASPDCTTPLPARGRGRPARYCSPTCRSRAHRVRRRHPGKVMAEVDQGSTTSRGRPAERRFLVRLRRDNQRVIVAWGLSQPAAQRLAEAITNLLSNPTSQVERHSLDGPHPKPGSSGAPTGSEWTQGGP